MPIFLDHLIRSRIHLSFRSLAFTPTLADECIDLGLELGI
jgi:hypothetical protein